MKTDARWIFLSTLIAAVIAVTYCMSANWLHISHASDFGVLIASDYRVREWGAGRNVLTFAWFAIMTMTVGVAFAMFVGKRRQYMPSLVPVVIAICALVAVVGVGLLLQRASYLKTLPWELDVETEREHPVKIEAANALWFMLAGFISIASSSMSLWKLARVTRRENAAALAHMNAAIAKAGGDLVPEDAPMPELVEQL